MAEAARTALVAGAVGRLGEALLNRVLASGDYRTVVALAQAPMALGVRGLALASLVDLPRLDDVFLLPSDSRDPAVRSFHGRDAPFVQVDASQVEAIAQAACQAGARRLVLVAPTPVWQQMGGLHGGLSGQAELALAALPLSSLTVLRPVAASASRASGLVERVAAFYTSLQLLAMPRSMEIIPSEKLARCALAAMRRAGDGVRIFGADRISSLLDPVAEGA